MVQELSRLLTLSIYTTNADRRNRLLHYPSRGAYTELQVLAVLENIGIARADSASALELHKLQPAELQGAFAALVDSKQGQHILAAAQQQLVPEILQTRNVRIVHNVMMQVQVNAAAMHFQSASWSRGSNTESMVEKMMAFLWAIPARKIACKTSFKTSPFLRCIHPIPMSSNAN